MIFISLISLALIYIYFQQIVNYKKIYKEIIVLQYIRTNHIIKIYFLNI